MSANDAWEKQAKSTMLLVAGRWASIMLVPIMLGIGQWMVATLNEVQKQVSDLRTKDIVELRVQTAELKGTATLLTGRMEDNVRVTNTRLDQQSEWIRKNASETEDIKKRLYPLTPTFPVKP